MIKQRSYNLWSRTLIYTPRNFAGILLLLIAVQAYPQTKMLIYDGITGISEVSVQNDTVVVSSVIPNSPADKAGIKRHDQIISINDSVVSGAGMNQRRIMHLLHDQSGTSVDLDIKRKGEDDFTSLSIKRDPYLHQIESHEYMYLVDSLGQWGIQDILSGSQETLFKDPLVAKITVFSIEKGSRAEGSGLIPGDQIISLADEMDADYTFHIGMERLQSITSDTAIQVIREDSLLFLFPAKPSEGDLEGITSQFETDFSFNCIWLKLTTENRLSASRTYLLNLPQMSGMDSLNFFQPMPSGEIIEKKSGILLPIHERDFIYKNWHAVQVNLNKGENQSFYLRWKAEKRMEAPYLEAFAHDTIVRYDRFERMVLFGFLFIMLIISAFFILLFVVMRGWQYLYFALYIGSLAIFLFITDGYLDEFFWKENNFFLKFLEKFQPYIMSWISIFFLLFGMVHLELRKKLKFWYRFVIVVLSLTGIRIAMVLLEAIFNFTYPAIVDSVFRVVWIFTVGIIPLFILIPPAIIRIRNGFRPAVYFLVANLVLVPLIYITLFYTLSSSSVLSVYESIPGRLFISSGMYIAAILQILIFSFGIAQKMRLDEIDRKRIQQQIIDQLKVNEKLKDKVNRELEEKVMERTREITDSIDYAQRIQLAVLPGEEYLDQILPEHFVFFKPKDIVSGDFYWIKEVNDLLIVVAADCTGHGVPGAFMSMLGITLLDEQLGKIEHDSPAETLESLRSKVKEMLVQKGQAEEQKDGMDMAIAIIDKENKELKFAGANNPLYLIRNGKQVSLVEASSETTMPGEDYHLYEFKGDRQPIGFYWEETKFTSHQLKLMDGDTLYVFSDGFVDQFGGAKRKKYKSQRFKELLLSIQTESMERQKQLLESNFESWRKDIEQIDDVCIIGVRL